MKAIRCVSEKKRAQTGKPLSSDFKVVDDQGCSAHSDVIGLQIPKYTSSRGKCSPFDSSKILSNSL